MVQDSPSRKLDQYIVRFPDGMRDKLKEHAALNNRSLNAEIIHRLEQSLSPAPEMTEDDLQSILQMIDTVKYNLVQSHTKPKKTGS